MIQRSLRTAAWLTLALIAVAGCSGDECERGAQRCDGRDQLECIRPGCYEASCAIGGESTYWLRTPCEETCVEIGGQPLCTLSEDPDPACADGNYCDGEVAVVCRQGYATARRDCAVMGGFCGLTAFDSYACLFSGPRVREEDADAGF